MSIVKTLFSAEVDSMFLRSDALAKIMHGDTKGRASEFLFRDLVRNILPKQFGVCDGFLSDAYGGYSRQLDLIVIDTSALPPILLSSGSVVLPVETCLASIEIKSRIDAQALDQVAAQHKSVCELKLYGLWQRLSGPLFSIRI